MKLRCQCCGQVLRGKFGMPRCLECSKPMKVKNDGRERHYCSQACRSRAHRRKLHRLKIAEQLKASAQNETGTQVPRERSGA